MKSEEMRRVEPDLYSSHREADHRYVPFLFKMSYYGLKAALKASLLILGILLRPDY